MNTTDAEIARQALWAQLVEDVADYQPHVGGFVVDPVDLKRAVELAADSIIEDGRSVVDFDQITVRELRVVGGALCMPAETLAAAIRLAALVGAAVEEEVRAELSRDVDDWWEAREDRRAADLFARRADERHEIRKSEAA